jgi:protein involved in polysaccharide export with SLBB domain
MVGDVPNPRFLRWLRLLVLGASWLSVAGCYAPLGTHAIPASSLPEEFRIPWRTGGPPLNLSTLTMQPPRDYLLGPNDILEVTIPGLYEQAEVRPLRAQVMANGQVNLPLVGSVSVQDMNLLQAQQAINAAFADGFIKEPRINVTLAVKSTTNVLVLGQVNQPGTFPLPKYENDVGHAIGAALGLTDQAADYIEVHRQLTSEQFLPNTSNYPRRDFRAVVAPVSYEFMRLPPTRGPSARFAMQSRVSAQPATFPFGQAVPPTAPQIMRIPLRGLDGTGLNPSDIILGPGDVVVVPDRRHEVFYVVGALNTTNTVRFTVGDRERELGVGFVLPRDREIDVVTAVAMAGYIDPIYSPTTVTVHRLTPDGQPMLILVDLIKARYDRCETILVQPGDILYLNPDGQWWLRRAIDRNVMQIFATPYQWLFDKW